MWISGLSNSATLWEKPKAYLIWGINDSTHVIEGTKFGDKTGEIIAKGLALLGNENAQQAVRDQAKYEQMIQEQQQTRLAIQQTTNAIKSIDFSQNIVQNITNPQPNVPFYNLPAPTRPVADLKRGAVIPLWLK